MKSLSPRKSSASKEPRAIPPSDDASWKNLAVGTLLKSGAIVQTAKDSYVDIGWNTDPESLLYPPKRGFGEPRDIQFVPRRVPAMIRLREDTVLGIDKLTISPAKGAKRKVISGQLDLRSGWMHGYVRNQTLASVFEVKFTNCLARVEGGSFTLYAEGIVSVGSGAVRVTMLKTDQNVEVTADFKFNTQTGERTEFVDDGSYDPPVCPVPILRPTVGPALPKRPF